MLEPLLSALIAGLVTVAVTRAVESLGGRLGGLVATLPTTIVPASLGIWAKAPSAEQFDAAMNAVPSGMLLNALYLLLWALIPTRLRSMSSTARLTATFGLSLLAWSGAAIALVVGLESAQHLVPALGLGLGGFALLFTLGVAACWRPPPAPRGTRRVGPGTLAARGLLAGISIGFAVWLSRYGGVLAGVASIFPAIFLTTMVSLWVSQGETVQVGAVGPMMLGSSSVATYALLATMTFPAWGPALGSVVAWLGSALLLTLPAFVWLRRRRERSPSSA